MTEIVKFVSNDVSELLEHINSHATEHYEDIQQVVSIEKTTMYNEAIYTAVVVFRRRKI